MMEDAYDFRGWDKLAGWTRAVHDRKLEVAGTETCFFQLRTF
jgi:hypothetical protein